MPFCSTDEAPPISIIGQQFDCALARPASPCTTPGPDTLAVEAFDPDNAEGGVRRLFTVLQAPDSGGPDLVIGGQSTFSLSLDGTQFILAAFPDATLPYHGLWAAVKGGRRVYQVLKDTTQVLQYPHLLN